MKKTIILFFILGIIYSCNININKSFKNDINSYKIKCLDKPFITFINMDSIVLSDFKNLNTIYPGALKNVNHSGIQLLCEYDSLNFNKMTSLIKNKTIRQLSFADTADYHMIDWKNKYNHEILEKNYHFPN